MSRCAAESLAWISTSGGYPILTAIQALTPTITGFNLGGVNGSGQVPESVGSFGLIDSDTPSDKYSITTNAGDTWELVFSDEFNTPGRTFWPGCVRSHETRAEEEVADGL